MSLIERDTELVQRISDLTEQGKLEWQESSSSGFFASYGPTSRVVSIQRSISGSQFQYVLVFFTGDREEYKVGQRSPEVKVLLDSLYRTIARGLREKSIDDIMDDLDRL